MPPSPRHGRPRSPASPSRSPASWASVPSTSARAWSTSPRSSRPRSPCPEDPHLRRQRQPHRHALRPEPRQRPARRQISADHGQAIVAIEDYRFYEHGALDLKGTPAPSSPTRPAAASVQGGSSITQQMVKQTPAQPGETDEEARRLRPRTPTPASCASCATRSPSRRSTPRTGSSSATSTSPTSATAPTASSRPPATTSPRTPRTSTCAQAATLAGLVKNPTAYDPTNNPERCLEPAQRRPGPDGPARIPATEEGRRGSRGQPQELDRTSPNGCQQTSRDAVLLRLRPQLLLKERHLGATPKDRAHLLNSGGLTIQTTIDLGYQEAAHEAVSSSRLPDRPGHRRRWRWSSPAPATSRRWRSPPDGSDKKRRVRPSSTTPSQSGTAIPSGSRPGSTFKVFVLADAINQGIPLGTTHQRAPDDLHPRQRVKSVTAILASRSGWKSEQLHWGRHVDL